MRTPVFHGTPGRPSYRRYHPSGRNKRRSGLTRHSGGGWLGSDRFDEDTHETALDFYTSTTYEPVNHMMRTGEQPENEKRKERLHKQISQLSDLIDIQEPTTSDKTLYRGMRTAVELNEGDEFHDRAFVSASADEAVSRRFLSDDGAFFRIHLPKGSKALDVASVGGASDEAEWILPAGTKYRVRKRGSVPGSPAPLYDVEVING